MDKQKIYEKAIGQKISYRTWERVLALLRKYELDPTKENVIVVARLKNEARKTKIPLEMFLKLHLNSLTLPAKLMTGKELLDQVQSGLKTLKPHRTTLKRWLNPYSDSRIYTLSEINTVFLHTTLYKLRRLSNESHQSTNRSRSLSTKKTKSYSNL